MSDLFLDDGDFKNYSIERVILINFNIFKKFLKK